LDDINAGVLSWQSALKSGELVINGDPSKLLNLLGMMEGFNPMFNIVTP